jgi:hypothetical protein
MFKILFGLVAALLSSSAFATIPVSYQYYNSWQGSGVTFATALLACKTAGEVKGYGSAWTAGPGTTSGSCLTGGGSGSGDTWQRGSASCPANSTNASGNCQCNTGYEENGSTCIATNAQCEVGKGRTFNRTEGFARSPDADADDVIAQSSSPPSLYGVNDGTCVGNLVPTVKCYRSQEPTSTGLYRTSCDYTMVVTGSAAPGTGDTAANPSTSHPACPGFVGEVNGKPTCVGTAASPLPAGTAPPNKPTAAGNPSAGVKPSTGPGSGTTGAERTPTTGNGGNAGGPAAAAVGSGGTGSRGVPGEDGEDATAVCGAPPLPSCNVKVDEAGTPGVGDAPGKFSESNAGVDEQKGLLDNLLGDIEDYSIGNWSWTFALPTGCTAFTVYEGVVLDPCAYQETFHDLMSVIWVLTGICAAFVIFEKGAA